MSNVVRFSTPISPEDIFEMQVVDHNGQIYQIPTFQVKKGTRWNGWYGRDHVNESAVDMLRLLNQLDVVRDRQFEETVDYIDEQRPNWKAVISTAKRLKEQEANRERKKALKALRKDPGTPRAFDIGGKYNSFSKQEIYSKKARNR